jgi:[acyl-carrier-protein] S-malonyltransferase
MGLAFLFPGQGSQRVGMAADLQAARPDVFDRYFDAAGRTAGTDLGRLCTEGTLQELTATEVAQPAIFALSAALDHLAREAGLEPALVAGHSLGEYSAAVAAGALEYEAALQLVCLRGRLMADVQIAHPGAMGALGGLSLSDVERLCAQAAESGLVVIANHNSPQQCVVSGEEAAVDRVLELAAARGADPALKLQVGAAFHSPLMAPVRDTMAEALGSVEWQRPRCPIATNAGGRLIEGAEELRAALVDQVTSRVRWLECMQALIAAGGHTFLELGPGRVLVGQARLIDHDLDAWAADGPKKLQNFVAGHPDLVTC